MCGEDPTTVTVEAHDRECDSEPPIGWQLSQVGRARVWVDHLGMLLGEGYAETGSGEPCAGQ
ncbi:hypothetical protein GCM10023066_29820 [Nocardioides kongjuensis]